MPGNQSTQPPPRAASQIKQQQLVRSVGRWLDRAAMPAWLPVILLVALVVPIKSVQEHDRDEGLNLAKAGLMLEGHRLYEDIWSDQFPLHTVALAGVLKVAQEVRPGEAWLMLAGGRMLSVLSACLLAAILYRLLRRDVSAPAAMAGTLFLLFSWMFVRMAGSIMIGLPAVALALLGCMLAMRGADALRPGRATWWLAASGAALSASLLVKPIAPLAVVAAIGWVAWASPRRARVSRTLWLAGSLVVAVLLLGLATSAWKGLLGQVLAAGLGSATRTVFAEQDVLGEVRGFLLRDLALVVIALVGIGYAGFCWMRSRGSGALSVLAERQPLASDPVVSASSRATFWMALAWLLPGVLLIALHRPVYWHHFLLVSLPLAWFAGYGAQALFDFAAKPGLRLGATSSSSRNQQGQVSTFAGQVRWLASGLLLAGLLGLGAFELSGRFRPSAELLEIPLDGEVTNILRAGVPEPVFTDRPIYTSVTYRAHAPWWVVLSEKRLANEPGFPERFGQMLDEAGVNTVVLERLPMERYGPVFAGWLEREFVRVDEPGGIPVYVRRSETSGAAVE